jgi:nicotinamidase-related amidase
MRYDDGMNRRQFLAAWCVFLTTIVTAASAEPLQLQLRDQSATADGRAFEIRNRDVQWDPAATALIVCDVWDSHHSVNAVRRVNEFAPRLNELVAEARRRGVTIIHAPSDCMAAYAQHPARLRAQQAPRAATASKQITEWCSVIPSERRGTYPIDQSDGGSDDDPAEARDWAAQLKAAGRNPGTPWLRQSPAIAIDVENDLITDRGDEVWDLLEARGVKNVILTGVHVNMCVLGRPFGLRRMVLGGKNTVLVRDLTDAMYNPAMWPYVDHFSGTDLIVTHIERYVCPTITSDQLLGGKPFRFAGDKRTETAIQAAEQGEAAALTQAKFSRQDELQRHWSTTVVPSATMTVKELSDVGIVDGPVWFRCVVRVPATWQRRSIRLEVAGATGLVEAVWWNGAPLRRMSTTLSGGGAATARYEVPSDVILPGDANLIVVRRTERKGRVALVGSPSVGTSSKDSEAIRLEGRWQFRLGDDPSWSNMPLPAKFGASPDVVFEASDPPEIRPLPKVE